VTERNRDSAELLYEDNFNADGVENLELRLSSEEVDICPSLDGNFRVVQYGVNLRDEDIITAELNGDTIAIGKRPGRGISFGFGFHYEQSWVEIYVPEKYHGAMDLGISSGDITLHDDLDLAALTAHVSSGSIRSQSAVKTLAADIYAVSGSIHLGAVETENFSIGASSGSVGIESLTGSGALEVVSGRITLDDLVITESLDMKVSSGSMHVTMQDDPSLEFTGRESSGNIRTYFDTYHPGRNEHELFATVGDGPYKQLTAQVSSGSINIGGSTAKQSIDPIYAEDDDRGRDRDNDDDWEDRLDDEINEWSDDFEDEMDQWADDLEDQIDRWDD
jgi:hypothetical protein